MDGTVIPLASTVVGAPLGYLGGGGRTLFRSYQQVDLSSLEDWTQRLTTWRRLGGLIACWSQRVRSSEHEISVPQGLRNGWQAQMNDTKDDASNVGSRESLLRSPSERGEAPTSGLKLDTEPLRAIHVSRLHQVGCFYNSSCIFKSHIGYYPSHTFTEVGEDVVILVRPRQMQLTFGPFNVSSGMFRYYVFYDPYQQLWPFDAGPFLLHNPSIVLRPAHLRQLCRQQRSELLTNCDQLLKLVLGEIRLVP